MYDIGTIIKNGLIQSRGQHFLRHQVWWMEFYSECNLVEVRNININDRFDYWISSYLWQRIIEVLGGVRFGKGSE